MIETKIATLFEKLLQEFDFIELKGSGFKLSNIEGFIVSFNEYSSLKSSKYVEHHLN